MEKKKSIFFLFLALLQIIFALNAPNVVVRIPTFSGKTELGRDKQILRNEFRSCVINRQWRDEIRFKYERNVPPCVIM